MNPTFPLSFQGSKKHRKSCEKLPWEWSVVKVSWCFCHNLSFEFCHNSNWVLSPFYFFFNFVTFKIFVFGLSFSFWVLSQWVFEFVTKLKTLIVTKLKNSNCDKIQKLKLRPNKKSKLWKTKKKTLILTKLKKSNCEKTKN